MAKKQKTIAAGEFKAKCLALLDEVAETGQEIVVTKRGKPVARLAPIDEGPSLAGSILWQGDLISPVMEWSEPEWPADDD
jgi:prevent-host-death family protein